MNWAVGSALAGLAGILIAPVIGLSIATLTQLAIPALAAAVLGGMTSLGIALAASFAIAVLQSEMQNLVHTPGWATAVPLLAVVAALSLRRTAAFDRSRVQLRFAAVGSGRLRWPSLVGVAALCIIGIWTVLPRAWVDAVQVSAPAAIVLLSIVVITGYAGQLSLAQVAMAGLGAVITARLIADWNWGLGPALLVACLAAIPLGVIIGSPALRTRGMNLAILTLVLAVSLETVVFNSRDISGGIEGVAVGAVSLFGIPLDAIGRPQVYATVAVVALVVVGLAVRNIRGGRVGRRLLAVRYNERAAAALGVSVVEAKLFAFAAASVIATIGGVLLTFRNSVVIFPNVTSSVHSQMAMANAVIGGVGFVVGGVAGAILQPGGVGTEIAHWFGDTVAKYLDIISGATLLMVLTLHPDGIAADLAKLGRWVTRGRRASSDPSSRLVRRRPSLERLQNERLVPPDHVLRVEGLTVLFGGVRAVDDVSFEVQPGEVLGVIGPNGAGKTTVLDAVSGFVKVAGGSIRFAGDEIGRLAPHRRARLGIARSFQSLELLDDLTVVENLLVASEPRDRISYAIDPFVPRRPTLSSAVEAAIREFDLEPHLNTKVENLPYGLRRLVAVARAVASEPSILLLDEPAAGLSETETRELAHLVRTLATDWNMGVLVIEHDVEFIMHVSDRVLALVSGRPVASGEPADVRADPLVLEAYLGAPVDVPQLDPAPVANGRTVVVHEARFAATATPTRVPVLAACGVSAGYGSIPVIRDVNLEVCGGEVVALLGANGAGKTTTVMTLAGALRPMSGELRWHGEPIAKRLEARCRSGTALVPEERSVLMALSTLDNLRLGRGPTSRALEIVPELSLLLDRKAGLLSGGEQQMLTLARALAAEPALLLADELSMGLAPLLAARLLDTARAAADAGAAVIIVEQQVRHALEIADRAYVMRRGEIVLSGAAPDLLARVDEIEDLYLSAASAPPVAVAT